MKATNTSLLVAGFAAVAAAQSDHAADGFDYVGCVKAADDAFPIPVSSVLPFEPEDCQEACWQVSQVFAAIRGGQCQCGPLSPPPEYELVDEASCNTPCLPDSDSVCGGEDAYSLYRRARDDPRPSDQETEDTTAMPTTGDPPSVTTDGEGEPTVTDDDEATDDGEVTTGTQPDETAETDDTGATETTDETGETATDGETAATGAEGTTSPSPTAGAVRMAGYGAYVGALFGAGIFVWAML